MLGLAFSGVALAELLFRDELLAMSDHECGASSRFRKALADLKKDPPGNLREMRAFFPYGFERH